MRRSLKWIAKLPLAPVIAAMFGLIALTLIFMTPVWLLERLVGVAGLAALIPAAQPPLGSTARILCAIAGGLGVFLLLWALLSPLQALVRKRRPQKAKGSRIGVAPSVPHMPPMKRPPIFAERELGAPFMSDEAIASAGELSVIPAVQGEQPDETSDESNAPAATQPSPAVAVGHDTNAIEDTVTPIAVEKGNRLGDEMARLEAALSRRNARGDFTRPRAATDPTALRNVLHHMG